MNAAIRAVTRACIFHGIQVKAIYRGYKGLMTGEIKEFKTEHVSNIIQRGGTILKTSRCDEFKPEEGRAKAYETLQREGINALVVIGGDGSITGAYNLAREYDIPCIALPGTIDNDLYGTDHCPGFASAAKYIATTCAEVWQDAHVYDNGMITVIEIMGRHAGWLAGSAALAGLTGCGPDLVYLPETDFDMDQFIADVKKIYDATGKCLIAVSEGIHYADGTFVSEAKTSATDGFGHAQLGGLAVMLADMLKAKTGAKVRGIELSLLQRCASHVASATDVEEAWLAGSAAVEAAVSGVTDKMVAFECTRGANGYTCKTVLQPLDIVANFEKKVPREWINAEGNGIEQPFIDYVLPLIQGESQTPKENALPRFAKLKKILTVDM